MVFFLGPYKLGVYKLSKKPEACVFKKVIFVDDSNSTTSKENLRQVFGVSDSDKTPVFLIRLKHGTLQDPTHQKNPFGT